MSEPSVSKEAIRNRVAKLRAEARELFAKRVSYGEHLGRSRLTDNLLRDAKAKEHLADELEGLL